MTLGALRGLRFLRLQAILAHTLQQLFDVVGQLFSHDRGRTFSQYFADLLAMRPTQSYGACQVYDLKVPKEKNASAKAAYEPLGAFRIPQSSF